MLQMLGIVSSLLNRVSVYAERIRSTHGEWEICLPPPPHGPISAVCVLRMPPTLLSIRYSTNAALPSRHPAELPADQAGRTIHVRNDGEADSLLHVVTLASSKRVIQHC